MAQFLALITTLGDIGSGLRPDNSLPQPPLGIWGGGNVPMPTPPMAPGGLPPGIWGGSGGLPGGGNYPSHPIAPGGTPPGIWGGSGGLPGGGNYPSQGLPGQPPGIWGGPGSLPQPPVHPSLPIYRPDKPLPGPTPPEGEEGGEYPSQLPTEPPSYVVVWIPGYGYALRPVGGEGATKPVDPAEPK